MRFWIGVLILVQTLAMSSGCSNSKGASPVQTVSHALPPLERSLHDRAGNEATVRLLSKNESVTKEQAPSCMAQAGDTLRSGTYEFDVQAGGRTGRPQSISLFDGSPLQFNENRPNMLEVWPGKLGKQGDYLLIRQYASCNVNLVSILSLSEAGGHLEVLPFQTSSGLKDNIAVSTIEQVAYNQLRTMAYQNQTGRTQTLDWKLDEQSHHFVQIQEQ